MRIKTRNYIIISGIFLAFIVGTITANPVVEAAGGWKEAIINLGQILGQETSCVDGQILEWNFATSTWVCAPDDDTVGSLSCLVGEIPKFIAGAWTCATDDTGVFSTQSCPVSTSVVAIDSNGNLICQGPTTDSCPPGSTLDSNHELCQGTSISDPSCTYGELSEDSCVGLNQCNSIPQAVTLCTGQNIFSATCTDGGPFLPSSCFCTSGTLSGNVCVINFSFDPTCPTGTTRIGVECISTPLCPSGAILNDDVMCEQPINESPSCPQGTTFNQITGLCG